MSEALLTYVAKHQKDNEIQLALLNDLREALLN